MVPPSAYPEFQPGIWDGLVIQSSPDRTGMLSLPFTFSYDPVASHGFDSWYTKHVRPTFVLTKGGHAAIVMNVTSSSAEPITVSFGGMTGFPEDYVRYTPPSPVVLEPGASREMALDLYVPDNATIPSGPGATEDDEEGIPVGLFLTSGEWSIGMGFYLNVIAS